MEKSPNRFSNFLEGVQFPLPSFLKRKTDHPLRLFVTLWPSVTHFRDFAYDDRLAGIRLNPAMINDPELQHELALLAEFEATVPMYFDVKGRQLRIEEVEMLPDHYEIVLNHPIELVDPQVESIPVLLKAGEDSALLELIEDDGRRLVFADGAKYGPKFQLKMGESIYIRHPSLKVCGDQFTDIELAKIDRVKKAGFSRYFLSYVESQKDVDEFLDLVGRDSEVWLKIENKNGLNYVANDFKKRPNVHLVEARGDLFVEVDRPHDILAATKLILAKDPEACVASRLMLSVIGPKPDFEPQVPSAADFSELAWLYDIGYRNMMFCDELCLHGPLLATAVNAFDSFCASYVRQ